MLNLPKCLTRTSTILAILAVVALILFWPILFSERLFSGFYVPLFHVYFFAGQKYLIHGLGVAPIWWPHFFSGYPIGLTLDGFWNPIFIVALKFLPVLAAYNWLTYLFFTINIAGCYAFTRALRLSRIASLIAAVAYGFSGIIMRWTDVIVFTTMFPILPLSFLAVLRIQQGNRRWWWIWIGLLSYGWIAGFAELMVYFLLATAGFCVFLLYESGDLRLSRWREATKKFFIPVLASVILVSPWLVSVLYFVTVHSNRSGGIPLVDSASMPLSLSYLIHIFLPRLTVYAGGNLPILHLGDDIDLFIGTVPLLLLITLLFTWKKAWNARNTFFLILLVFALLMSFRSPLYILLHQLPILRWFRWHFKWSFITVFAASILAGYAVDSLHAFFSHRYAKKTILFLWVVFGSVMTLSLIVAIFAKQFINRIVEIGLARMTSDTSHVFTRSTSYYEEQIRHMTESLMRGISITNPLTATTFILWALALIVFTIGVRTQNLTQRLRHYLLATTILGSSVIWMGFLVGQPTSYLTREPATAAYLHRSEVYRQLPITQEMAATHVPYRIFTFFPNETLAYIQEKSGISVIDSADSHVNHQLLTRELLSENINTWFEVDGSFNNEPLADAKTLALHQLIPGTDRRTTSTLDNATIQFSTEEAARHLGIMNVKYVLTPLEISGPWKLVFTNKILDGRVPVHVYENPFFLPRWYFATNIEWRNQLLNAQDPPPKFELDFISKDITLLEPRSPEDAALRTMASIEDRLNLVEYTAGRLTLNTRTEGYRWVVFSETGAPFWRARIDGQNAPLVRANYAYQALLVPPGSHHVEFYVLNFWQQARASLASFIDHP